MGHLLSTLGERTWPQVDAGPAPIVAVPVGSCEQHGPHLPLSTDTLVAVALCRDLAARRGDVLVAPTVGIGASGEHAGFAGTLSVGTEVLGAYLVELVRSAREWARGLVVVSGHGGNADALAHLDAVARHEGDLVCTYLPHIDDGDAHAGRTETSLVLALAPEQVRHNDVVVGRTEPLPTLLAELRASGVRSVSPSGVLGDPRGASADEGEALLAALGSDLEARVTTAFGPGR